MDRFTTCRERNIFICILEFVIQKFILHISNLATAPVGKNVCQVAQNVCWKMYVKTRPGTGTHRMSMSPGMYTCYILY